ncbi:MAG: hypothetical protein ABIY55_30780, partial [Kofleriaceae bacterium]
LAAGVALAAWVAWRATTSTASASHAWLAGTILAYAVAFMRVPFHIYWRADAPLLAQLPIEGRPLFDAALTRCMRAAEATTIAVGIGLLPLLREADGEMLVARHVAYAVTLGLAAALLLPGVTVGAAALVVQGGGAKALRAATALAGAPGRVKTEPASQVTPPSSPAAILGALPGFAASVVIVAMLFGAPWLLDEAASAPAPIILGVIVVISIAAAFAARAGASVMGRVLRDVSALDRQRLATLEIKPPTPIEQAIAGRLGAAAPPYRKDARLMRRRYPMAYALGALVFIVLVIVGIAQPDDPTPWLTVAVGGAAIYGLGLATRLARPPIELARLSATLPLTPTAQARAKLAWLLGWWSIFVAAPAVFAALRQTDSTIGLALAGAATLVMIVAGASRR